MKDRKGLTLIEGGNCVRDYDRDYVISGVRRVVDALSAPERHLLMVRVMADAPTSFRRISITYGISPQAVRQRYVRLIAKLRVQLAEFRDVA